MGEFAGDEVATTVAVVGVVDASPEDEEGAEDAITGEPETVAAA